MKPYYVPSLIALKKGVKQFHNELKKNVDEPVTLGWSRDFTAGLLSWPSWNALYLAHHAPLNEDAHHHKLFGRTFMHTQAQVEDLQTATCDALAQHYPSMDLAAIRACAEKLWHKRRTPLTPPFKRALPASNIPEEYWLDNTFIYADNYAYDTFILNSLVPVASKNGGLVLCDEDMSEEYASALGAQGVGYNVLDLSACLDKSPSKTHARANDLTIIFDRDESFWEQFNTAWRSALQYAKVTDTAICVGTVADAITLYYKKLFNNTVPNLDALYDMLQTETRFKNLPGMLTRSLSAHEHSLLSELQRITDYRATSALSLSTEISNAHNTIMKFCGVRSKGVNTPLSALRGASTALLVICPRRDVSTSCEGYAAGIVDILCAHIRQYGFAVSPSTHPQDTNPPRVLVLPYNGRYSPASLGMTVLGTMMSGWGIVAGGHTDVSRWNTGSNRTCLETYRANAGNVVEIKEEQRMLFLRGRKKVWWYSCRHPRQHRLPHPKFYPHDEMKDAYHYMEIAL